MTTLEQLFPTHLYRAPLARGTVGARLRDDLERAALQIAEDDRAGQAWSREHGYKGYTSYASLDDLPWRDPSFGELAERLDGHAADFARALDFDLTGRKLVLDSFWINVLEPGGQHGSHIHPGSVISGTYYVAVPDGAAGLKLEDPRLGFMMGAPPQRASVRAANRRFVEVVPKPGTVLMWESWLRHEVPVSRARVRRISISFNYALGPLT
mgnify:CR=1 FL=1